MAAAVFQANTGTYRCTPVTRTARTCAWAWRRAQPPAPI